MSFFASQNQKVTLSTRNSSSSNINASASYVGLADSTLNVNSIQVTFKGNQNCNVYIDQSPGLSNGTGTVTTNGTTTLIGSGTNFLSRRVGDEIFVSGETVRIIATIVSDTELTVTSTFSTSNSGLSYQMYDWDINDEYEYLYSINNFSRTVQAVNSFFRVRIMNLSTTSATTYFRLQSILLPIGSPTPRSTDEHDHLPVKVSHISDLYGFEVENTPMGEMRVITPIKLVGSAFDGTTIDTNFWTVTNAAGGTTTQANAQITLATNTTANGSTKINSLRRSRYLSGTSNGYRARIQLGDTGTANNVRRWGVAWGATMPTYTDGAYFQLSGTTFSIVTLKGGSATTVNNGSFNGSLGATYDLTTVDTTYEIYWTNGKVYFVIGDEILHTVTASSATWANTMNFHIYHENTNSSGSTSNVTMSSRVSSVRRFGALNTQPTSKFQSGTTAGNIMKYGPGNLNKIIISTVTSGSVITLYDNTAASGTILWQGTLTFGNQGGTGIHTVNFGGLPFATGLTLVIATQNSNVLVIYE